MDQIRGGGGGGRYDQSGGGSAFVGQPRDNAIREMAAGRGMLPRSWKHLLRQSSGEQAALISQQGQSDFWGDCLSAPFIIFSQSVMADMSAVSASDLVAAACIAAHAEPIGASVTATATKSARMMRASFKGPSLLTPIMAAARVASRLRTPDRGPNPITWALRCCLPRHRQPTDPICFKPLQSCQPWLPAGLDQSGFRGISRNIPMMYIVRDLAPQLGCRDRSLSDGPCAQEVGSWRHPIGV